MKILLLGPHRHDLEAFLASFGDEIFSTGEQLTINSPCLNGTDFLISYGYRYILKQDVLDKFPMRAINLHISLLPWNRGADPNLWSFLNDTPHGVTIHFLDQGIDTGDILVQEQVSFSPDNTLRTSYERLSLTLEALFKNTWPAIREGRIQGIQQSAGGSLHFLKDRMKYENLLTQGWDTPVANLIGKANNPDLFRGADDQN